MSKKNLTRREFISSIAAVGAAVSMPSVALGMRSSSKSKIKRKRVLRAVHLSDVHVKARGVSVEGWARALRSIQSLKDKPDVIFNTGDSIMDSLGRNKVESKAQWKSFKDVLKNGCSLKMYHCLGNHDVWGWHKSEPEIVTDPLYGKALAVKELSMPGSYYSFTKAGWKFIVLDSMYHVTGDYIARLDEEQFAWLQGQLKQTPPDMPLCVLSHIPILCVCIFLKDEAKPAAEMGSREVVAHAIHVDARRIKDLFYKHKNVRLCLSGHMHMHDKVEYLGVKYVCGGAVSGSWWDGSHHEFPPAYMIVDFYNDGSSTSEFVPYKWKEA